MENLVRDVGSIKANFENSPTTLEHARNLVDFCLNTRVAVSSLGIGPAKLDEALANPDIADLVRVNLAVDLKAVYDGFQQTKSGSSIQADLELAESLARVSPDPDSKTLFFLFLCNNMIARHRKALEYLLGAAKKDLAKYGPLYIKNCFELKDQWLKKAIEFYESSKEALDSILDDRSKTMIAIAYDRVAGFQSESFTKKYDSTPEGVRQYIQTKGLLTRALVIYRGVYENDQRQISEEQQPLTEENASHLTNYAVNLCQLDTLSDRNKGIDEFSVNLKSHYRNESILILQDLIHRIDQLPSPSERLLWKQKIAKVQWVYAAAGEELGAEINERAISIAEELKGDPGIQGTDGYSNFLNFYGIHLGIRRRRRLKTADFSEEEKVFLEALNANWKNPRSYLALADIFNQRGEPENAKRYLAYRHLVQVWIEMRQIVRFETGEMSDRGRSADGVYAGENLNNLIGRFNKALKAFLGEAEGQGATCEKIFRPLKKILKVYSKRVRKWIGDIVPEGGGSFTTQTLSPYLILLRMLREGMGNVTEIKNLLMLKVETETEEWAKVLCAQIGDGMNVLDRREGADGNRPEGLGPMDLIGSLPGDSFDFLVRVSAKEKESVAEKSAAECEANKRNTVDELEAEIAKDPLKYLQNFYDILVRLGKANRCFTQGRRGFSTLETLKIYEDPDRFMKQDKK